MATFDGRFAAARDQSPLPLWLAPLLNFGGPMFDQGQGFGGAGLLPPDEASAARAPAVPAAPQAAPMLPELDGDNNPIPGMAPRMPALSPAAAAGESAMAQAPMLPQAPQAAPGAPQGGPDVLGGLARGIGGLLGRTQGPQMGPDGQPQLGNGPRSQAVRFLMSRGMDINTAVVATQSPQMFQAIAANMLKAPEPTSDIKNFQFGQKNPDFVQHQLNLKRAGAITVKNEGNIPPGYEVERDDQGRPIRLRPIPGSPAAIEAQEKADKLKTAQQQREVSSDVVTQDIGRAINIVEKSPFTTTGQVGELLSRWKGSEADNLRSLIQTLEANVSFDKLQAMRAASPTGGALGNVSNQENAMLASTLGALKASQGKDQLVFNLKRLHNVYNDVVHGPGAGPKRFDLSQKDAGGQSVPSGIDPKLWQHLTPEERALWQK